MMDLTGKQNALEEKEELQRVTDHWHHKVKKKISWMYGMNHKLKDNLALVQKYKKYIIADEEERAGLYQNLGNLLSKEEMLEDKMWKTTQKGRKVNTINIKQKFKDSELEESNFNAMQEVLKQYPELSSKSTYKNLQNSIKEKEKEIKITKKKHSRAVSEVLRELSYWPRNISEGEDFVKRFNKELKKAKEKLNGMRYFKSVFYRISSEREKRRVNINTDYYKMDEMENTIKIFKEEVKKSKKQDLEEMDY